MFFKKPKLHHPKQDPQAALPSLQQIDTFLAQYRFDGKNLAWTKVQLLEGVLELGVVLDDPKTAERLHEELGRRLADFGVKELNLTVGIATKAQQSQTNLATNLTSRSAQACLPAHPRIRHIIAIASGKGGVGKSTTAVNVALALQKLGARVGLLDADIYGPSLPDMLGVAGVKPLVENGQFVPVEAHGLALMSIGSLLESEDTPVAWRGIKAVGALMQLYHDTAYPHLDYLVIDMPPGTGDIALTMAQKIPITAAVIVTTPQHIALLDVKKGIELFAKTDIGVLGIVENMALHTCSQCGHTEAVFGGTAGEDIACRYGVPLLGRLPLALGIGQAVEQGVPSVVACDDFAKYYEDIAQKIMQDIEKFAKPQDPSRIF